MNESYFASSIMKDSLMVQMSRGICRPGVDPISAQASGCSRSTTLVAKQVEAAALKDGAGAGVTCPAVTVVMELHPWVDPDAAGPGRAGRGSSRTQGRGCKCPTQQHAAGRSSQRLRFRSNTHCLL